MRDELCYESGVRQYGKRTAGFSMDEMQAFRWTECRLFDGRNAGFSMDGMQAFRLTECRLFDGRNAGFSMDVPSRLRAFVPSRFRAFAPSRFHHNYRIQIRLN
ncbi:MAG: hypothetical protein LBC19_01660 [Tannerella sp.]|nr:hypothetical protein [Tannerella sp.]